MQKLIGLMVLCFGISSQLFAQHAGDIELTVVGNKIVTGQRVYASEMGLNFDYFSDTPGFDGVPGTFLFPSSVGFNILGPVKQWDGFDFDANATGRIKITNGPANRLSPTTNTTVSGFTLAVNAAGEWHNHLGFELVDSSGASLAAPLPLQLPGIYMLTLEMKSTDPTVSNSDPFYMVFNNGMPEVDHLAAEAFVNANVVPEPSTWAILMMAGFGSAWAWKRRRSA